MDDIQNYERIKAKADAAIARSAVITRELQAMKSQHKPAKCVVLPFKRKEKP